MCVLMVCVTPPPDQLEVGVFILSACERLLVRCLCILIDCQQRLKVSEFVSHCERLNVCLNGLCAFFVCVC